ncbi:hypothetical protein BDW02DRAFT_581849 [Decorospora gaudefroyi]|uniref:RapZ C-terminal domain-containing protein n=1 Tax=Decorospora gaudefroyi TaxID=184978 RepID=A0A6A5K9K4_9PLEO|nr:hypothetical protein BDW02DRAFT_581849 [Decorospora gaudefroyi]
MREPGKDREERERERERAKERRYTPLREPPRPPREARIDSPPTQRKTYYEYEYNYDREERHRFHHTPRPTIPHRPISFPYPPLHNLPPTQPTIYIITYATTLLPSESSITHVLTTQVPHRHPPIPHLYTIDARNMQPPSPSICERYSGTSPLVQDIVMRDRAAREAAHKAVRELLRFGEEQRRRGSKARGVEVSMSVCCHAGTHRSVAIAERIAQGVKMEVGRLGCADGVRVVCRHVHRVRGLGDPF